MSIKVTYIPCLFEDKRYEMETKNLSYEFAPYGKVTTHASIPADWKLVSVLPQQQGFVLWFQDKVGNVYVIQGTIIEQGLMIKGADKLTAK